MNLSVLEKIARQVLNGKAGVTVNNSQLNTAERRAFMSASWKVTPGGAAAGTYAIAVPYAPWG